MAITVGAITQIIEALAPLSLKEEWDRPGIALGDPQTNLKGVLVSLDVTEKLIGEALSLGANLIVTHHPLLFIPPAEITALTSQGRRIRRLIKADIAVYSAHTNLDKAGGGLNEIIMELLGFPESRTLSGEAEDFGRVADIPPILLRDLAQRTAQALETDYVRCVGEADQLVGRVAVINGAGEDFIQIARAAGAQCVITGDTTYHAMQDAREEGIAVIDPGHFASEWKVFRQFMQKVEAEANRQGEIPFYYAQTASDPYYLIHHEGPS